MNDNDAREQEVRSYVRNRMAGDIPPEFTGNVMNQVQRTNQRSRGFAWPIFAAMATVAAAALVVTIGLNLINQDGVGSQPTSTPSPSASASTTPSVTPEASASAEPTISPSADATTTDGEFGPVHSMAPDDAFPNAQTCDNPDGITTVGEPSDVSYTIAFPDGWSTNEASDARSACSLFAPEPFEVGADGTVPETVAISADLPPGGDYGAGGSSVTTEEYTVDGVAAVRYEMSPEDGGFITEPTVVWIIAISGSLPAEGNDQPYLAISTSSSDPDELADWTDVLDRMVATLDIGE